VPFLEIQAFPWSDTTELGEPIENSKFLFLKPFIDHDFGFAGKPSSPSHSFCSKPRAQIRGAEHDLRPCFRSH
jgi:hypothetical protein